MMLRFLFRRQKSNEASTCPSQANRQDVLASRAQPKMSTKILPVGNAKLKSSIASRIGDLTRLAASKSNTLKEHHAFALINNVPEAMAVIDLNGKILGTNAEFKSTFLLSVEHSDCNIIELIAPEDKDRFYRAIDGVDHGSIERGEDFASNMKSVKSQGESTDPAESSFNWVMRRDCCDGFILVTIRASFTRARSKAEIEEERKSLQEKLETKRIFVRHVSHEIRTPLNVVMSGLNLLSQMVKEMTPEMKELLEEIKSACVVAVEILNDLLTYEKLDGNILQLERSAYDIVEILRRVFEMFKIPARYSGVSLEMIELIESKRAIVDVDSTKLSQVLRNLVSNSLKFTPKGGSVRVVVGLSTDQKSVRIEVRDTGAGMSRENRAKLFKEIVQFNAKELQNGQGSGMGLFISRRVIDMHGGSIGVDLDWEGPGSVFYLELPLSAELVPSSRARKLSFCLNHSETLTTVISDYSLPRLLIADDAAICRRFHCRLLEQAATGLMEASNGQEAIDIIKSGEHFDGILMDANMPFVDGLEATRAIRALGFRGKIFGVTGNGFQSDIDDFMAAGADEVLVKPLTAEKYTYISLCCKVD